MHNISIGTAVTGVFMALMSVKDQNGTTASASVQLLISAVPPELVGALHVQYRNNSIDPKSNQIGPQLPPGRPRQLPNG